MAPLEPADVMLEARLRRACAELDRRLRAGETCRAEEYLATLPELTAQPDVAVELIYTEFVARQERGEAPTPEEYYRRFPQWRESLAEQFEIHSLVDGFLANDRDRPRPTPGSGSGSTNGSGPRASIVAEGGAAGSDSNLWLGRYELGEEVGRGAMGVVYRARDVQLGRHVAIKVLLAGAHAGPKELDRWRREAEAIARLAHPNIVQVLEVGTHEGRPSIALEYVPGPTLAERIGGKPQPAREAAELMETLARAVHFAHEQGIIHRDLKPANVLMTAEGAPKIADFGLAKRFVEDSGQTKTGAMIGTPSYMAPEQTGMSKYIGPASDVYALGAILYELLTGRPPFVADNALSTARQVVFEEPVPPRQRVPRVPRDLDTIALKCLAKEPTRRYATAGALADDLRRYLAGEPIAARPVSLATRGWKWARRHPVASTLAGMICLAVLVVLTVSLSYTAALKRSNELLQKSLVDAEEQRGRAEEQTARFQAELERAQRGRYALQLNQVASLWKADPGRARQLLEDSDICPYELRDFTWSYYSRLCSRQLPTVAGGFMVDRFALSEDGSLLAVASPAGDFSLWDARKGDTLLSHGSGRSETLAMAFRRDPQRIIEVCKTGLRVRAYTLADGFIDKHDETLRVDEPAFKPAISAAISPLGKWAATGHADGSLRLWSLSDGLCQGGLPPGGQPVTAIAVSPQGDLIAAGSPSEGVRLWNVDHLLAEQPKPVRRLEAHRDTISAMAFSPNGEALAVGSSDELARVWRVADGHLLAELGGHLSPVLDVAYSPDGRTLATASRDMGIKLWETATFQEQGSFKLPTREVRCVRFAPDRPVLWASGGTRGVQAWQLEPPEVNKVIEAHRDRILALAISPDGEWLASSSRDQTLALHNLLDPKLPPIRRERMHRIRELLFTPEGQLVSVHEDRRVQLWSVPELTVVREFKGHTERPFAGVLSRDGKLLATSGDDGTARIWQLASGRKLAVVSHPGAKDMAQISAVAISPNGQTLVTAGRDAIVRVWDLRPAVAQMETPPETPPLQSLPTRGELRGHTDWVHSAAFAPDGKLATGSFDETAHIWDLDRMQSWRVLTGHSAYVMYLAFSPDGRTLVTAGGDRWAKVTSEVKLWDPETAQVRATWAGESGPLAFWPAGRLLATGSETGQVKLWFAPVFSLSRAP